MAKPKPKPKAKPRVKKGAQGAKKKRAGKPGQSFLGSTMTLGVVIAMLVLALPTALLVFVGFLPTLAAWLVDNTPRRYAARTVAGLNFAGVAPYILKLWSGHNDIVGAGQIITDPFALIVMFGAAAVGWTMFIAFPGFVSGMSSMNAQRRIAQLRERQRSLVEEWGSAVAALERRPAESPADPLMAAPPAALDRDRAA